MVDIFYCSLTVLIIVIVPTLYGSKMSATPVEYRLPPPLMGEHTEQVLKELGYGDEDRKV
jgi:crotonobetainyl-CoA:carnitine CoA-transferase CaiB-like acyl-CoA transferase